MSSTFSFTQAGSYSLVVPAETRYTVVAIGGGGGGAYILNEWGRPGIASTVTSSDHTVNLTAAGGTAPHGVVWAVSQAFSTGHSPGNFVYPSVNGIQYIGGATSTPSPFTTTAGHAPGGGGGGVYGLLSWSGGGAGTWVGGSYENLTGHNVTLTVTVGSGGPGGLGGGPHGGNGMVAVVTTPVPLAGTPNTLPGRGALTAIAKAKKFIFTGRFAGHGAGGPKYPGTGIIFATDSAVLSGAGQLSSRNTYARFHVTAELSGNGAAAGIITNDIIFFDVLGQFFVVADPSISGVRNQPIVAPLNAKVSFTPRLPPGTLIPLGNYLVTPAYNSLQQVFLIGNPTGGTWTLQHGTAITGPLAYDISPADLATALDALPTIGANNVHVTEGLSSNSYNVEFIQFLGNRYIPPMIANADLLSNVQGPGFCEATVAANLQGSTMVIEDTSTVIAVVHAQILNGQLCTIDHVNTPGLQLVANSSQLALDKDLIYDVEFTKITYNGVAQSDDLMAPFAFAAPTSINPVCLSDPSLPKLPFKPVRQTPPFDNTDSGLLSVTAPKSMMRLGWRERAHLDTIKTPIRRPSRATVPTRRGR